MTNFSGRTRRGLWAWLSPERAVLVVPVFVGMGLSVLVFSAAVTPLSLRMKNQQAKVDELKDKSDQLPLREIRLRSLKATRVKRVQQQERLLALVAGTSNSALNTFLAQLNNLAVANQVTIATTQPGDIILFVPPVDVEANGGTAPPAAGGSTPAELPRDALLAQGIEKRSVGLTVKGSFPNVFGFLRSLERLEVFISVSELEVQSEKADEASQQKVPGSEVSLKLKLTAYGRHFPSRSISGNAGSPELT